MIKEHPILFSSPMVEANLEGRKRKTRRIVKGTALDWLQPGMFAPEYVADPENNLCPYGKPGDLLWVRETWQVTDFLHPEDENWGYIYKASETGRDWQNNNDNWKWRPSIFMPKIAARIWLEVTDVKIERVQDISEEDILAEGVRYPVHNGQPLFKLGVKDSALHFMPEGFSLAPKNSIAITEYHLLYAHWAELWCKINGRESWDANPWVWVVGYKIVSTTGKPLFKKLSEVNA